MKQYKKYIGCMAVDLEGEGKQYFYLDGNRGVSVSGNDKWDWNTDVMDDYEQFDEVIVGASCLAHW